MAKNPLANAGDIRDLGSIPGSGRSSEEGKGNPLQYSCLENPMGRGAWKATVHGVTKSWISSVLKCFAQRLTHHNNSRVKYYCVSHFSSEET